MERYKNIHGNSGVYSFLIEETSIIVKFKNTKRTYRYSYTKAGQLHVEKMKQLAKKGKGLNSYIKRNVNKLYDR